jgi:hypothetical protein
MRGLKTVSLVVALAACAHSASSQQLHTNTTEILSLKTGQPQAADCSDFMRNVDGSWQNISPLMTKSSGKQNVVRGTVLFQPGVSVNDLDVGGILEKACNK